MRIERNVSTERMNEKTQAMKQDKELKEELIAYIKKNEPSFADTDLDDFSLTQLIIISQA